MAGVLMAFLVFMIVANIVCRIRDTYTIPKVVVGKTTREALTHEFEGEGVFTSSEHTYMQPQNNWKIEKVYIKEGQMIEENMPLWKYDTTYLQGILQELQEDLQKYQITVEKEQIAGKSYVGVPEEERALQELQQAMSQVVCEQQWLVEAIERYEKRIKEINEAYDKKEGLVKQNAKLSRTEEIGENEKGLMDIELQRELMSLQEARTQEKENAYQEIIGKNESLFLAIQEMDRQELAYQNAIREANAKGMQAQQEKQLQALVIEEIQLDMVRVASQIQSIQDAIEAEGYVYAQETGMISKVEIEEGMIASGLEKVVVEHKVDNFSFVVKKEEANEWKIGDVCIISIQGAVRDLKGEIVSLVHGEDEVEICCEETGDISWSVCHLNQQGRVKVIKKTEEYMYCIPIHAIVCKGGTYYCRIVTEQNTILGTEQIVTEEKVVLLDQDAMYAAVEGNIHEEMDIVMEYNKILQSGDRVRVVREIMEEVKPSPATQEYTRVKVRQPIQEDMITMQTMDMFTCYGEDDNCYISECGFGRIQEGTIKYVAGAMQQIKDWELKSGTLEIMGDEKGIIISTKLAEELFHTVDAVGQEIMLEKEGEEENYYVRGVVEEEENVAYVSAVIFLQESQEYAFTEAVLKHGVELKNVSIKQTSLQQLYFQLEKNGYPEIDMIG